MESCGARVNPLRERAHKVRRAASLRSSGDRRGPALLLGFARGVARVPGRFLIGRECFLALRFFCGLKLALGLFLGLALQSRRAFSSSFFASRSAARASRALAASNRAAFRASTAGSSSALRSVNFFNAASLASAAVLRRWLRSTLKVLIPYRFLYLAAVEATRAFIPKIIL